MAEKYYKVAESTLKAIADAIRFKKESETKYTLDKIPAVIRAMNVLPSDLATTGATINAPVTAVGILPVVHYGNANSGANVSVSVSAVGILTE